VVQAGALGVGAVVTGTDGAYEIDHLPSGEFRVLARTRGFEPASIPSAVPGQQLPDLVLARHARIAGRVRDSATGAPLASFSVRLDRKDAEGSYHEEHRKARDVDDDDGYFACEGLRAGEWRVRVVSKEHLPWQRAVSLAPGGEVELDVALTSGGRIEGTVVRPDGTPITGATITARLAAEGREGERRDPEPTRSGEDGGYAFAGLDEGPYQVQAVHPDHYAEGSEGTARVEVSSAQESSVRFVLRPAGRIFGRIRGLTFKTPGWSIWVVGFSLIAADPAEAGARKRRGAEGAEAAPRAVPVFQVWTDQSGIFQRDSIRPGRYKLDLVHRRKAPDTGDEWITVPPENRLLGEVEIRAGEMATFECEAP
jgi:protocatechuate 3,4-dioxygenase beta subunit